MPELNSNIANSSFQDKLNQRSKLVNQADRYVKRCTSLNGIPEVDMSNEEIFAMIISSWGLQPSSIHLPLVQENDQINSEDLSELLSVITHDRIFS